MSSALVIGIALAVVFVALIALGGRRQRQKRFIERRGDARQLDEGARERTERIEHERDTARERAEQADDRPRPK